MLIACAALDTGVSRTSVLKLVQQQHVLQFNGQNLSNENISNRGHGFSRLGEP